MSTTIWTYPGAAIARTSVALALAGLAGGTLAPTVASLAPWAPAALLGCGVAVAGWIARGGMGPVLPRAAVGLGGGAIAGLLLQAPAGLAHAAFGLAAGLALATPRGRDETAGARALDALPVAAGALAGGMLAGGLAASSALGGLPPEASAALLAGLVALGVAAGDAVRQVRLIGDTPSAWILDVQCACEVDAPLAHLTLAAACDAYRGTISSLADARLDGAAVRETAILAQDLLGATAHAAEEARRMTRAAATLAPTGATSKGVDPDELGQARAKIGASLDARRDAALDEAAGHAAALARLAATLVERSAGHDRPLDSQALDRRADALARRALSDRRPDPEAA